MKTIAYASLAVLLLAGACGKKENEQQAQVPDIDVEEAYTDSIVLHKTFPGYIVASTVAKVVGRVNGQILSRNYDDGTYITKGTVLFKIESSTYRDAVTRAQAALATARSEYAYAKDHYAAMEKALKADAVSKISVLQAKSAMEQAQAAISDAQAALQTAQTQLGYCTIVAPVSGYITQSTLDPGNYISGEGAPVTLASIYDTSKLVAQFDLSEEQYEKLVGQGVGIDAPIYRNVPLKFSQSLPHTYTADLNYESPLVDKSTGTLRLQGEIINKDHELKDGMYITVSLPYGVEPRAILVKEASIGTDQLGKYLYCVNDSNKVVYTPIEVGELYQDSLRVVTKGIKPGQRYVSKALMTVRNGQQINPVVRGRAAKKTK